MVPVSTRRRARNTHALALAGACAALGALALAPAARAQSAWLDHDHRTGGLVEVLFPSFDGGDTKFPDWTWYAAGRFPLGEKAHLVAELPYTRMSFEGETSHSTIGNPYLGIELGRRRAGPRVELGVRAPLASDSESFAWFHGYLSDIDREEAFVPDALPLRLGLHYHHAAPQEGGFTWDLRLVPSAWIKTKDRVLTSNQTFLGYGGTARYEGRAVRLGAGFTGRWNLTHADVGFGESTVHQAEFAFDFLRGSVHPGVQLKLPLDHDLRQAIDKSWGFTLSVLPTTLP